jgi:hypothetical protein
LTALAAICNLHCARHLPLPNPGCSEENNEEKELDGRYPALQIDPEGGGAMVFTISGPTLFASAAFARISEDGHGDPITIAAPGTGPYAPSSTRWGDYSWAVADPNGKSIWLATEYIPPADRQTVDGLQNWGTRVLEISTGQ